MNEIHSESLFAILLKSGRRDVGAHRQVVAGGLEVLADGEEGAGGRAQVAEGFDDFFGGFAEAEHEAGFGGDSGVGDLAEDGQAGFVVGYASHEGGQAADGFDVVGQDVGACAGDLFQGFGSSAEVGDEGFYGDSGVDFSDGLKG